MTASHADTSMFRAEAFGTMPAFAIMTAGGSNACSAVATRFATAAASRTSTGMNTSRSMIRERCLGLVKRVLPHITQDDAGSRVMKRPSDAQTDARRRAGHDHDLPIEPRHRFLAPCNPIAIICPTPVL